MIMFLYLVDFLAFIYQWVFYKIIENKQLFIDRVRSQCYNKLIKKTDCPRGGKAVTMKITKEMVAKHIMNQSEISEPFDETKKCAMAFCYSEGSNIVFRDVWKEELKEWGALDKYGDYDTDFESLENENFMRICQELADKYNSEYED